MNNDERPIDDGDIPEDGPEEGLDSGRYLDAYDDNGEDGEELDEAEAEGGVEATAAEPEVEAAAEPAEPPPVFNNFMDALYPKRAPAPCNARIIRRFDLEAAKYDPRPATPPPTPMVAPAPVTPAAPVVAPKKKEPLTREEARALRNRSLRAAAGLD